MSIHSRIWTVSYVAAYIFCRSRLLYVLPRRRVVFYGRIFLQTAAAAVFAFYSSMSSG